MIFVNDLTAEIYEYCLIYWYVAIGIYLLRILSSSFNNFTSYGKLHSSRSTTNNTNANENNRSILSALYLDYQLFETKYGWFLFYLTAFSSSLTFLFIIYMLEITDNVNYHNCIFLILFYSMMMLQASRRIYETIVVQVHSFSMMNILLFVSGISYYLMATISPIAEYIFRVEVKYIQPPKLDYDNQYYNDNEITYCLYLIIAVFIAASYQQQNIHKQLAAIRNSATTSTANPAANDNAKPYYAIPKGGLFNLVSCPHFLMEIVIYFCFLSLSYYKSKTLWLLFIFTSMNLIHRALETHEWYKNTYKSAYPANRKAIIPFII